MSDIPSGALQAGQSRAVSLLARVIMPRPGEPLDVRKLYIEESETNSRRAHPPTRTELEIGTESEVSFATYFNAFPASYWRRWSTLQSVVLHVELTGSGRPRTFTSGHKVTLKNAKDKAVTVLVDESLPGDWTVLAESAPHQRLTANLVRWSVAVPAGGRAELTFKVRFTQ